MEEEHRYIPTPTQDHKLLGLLSARPTNLHFNLEPSGERGGNSRLPTPSHVNNGKRKFVNSRTFSTLTTKLSANVDQPISGTEIARSNDGRDDIPLTANPTHSHVASNDSNIEILGNQDSLDNSHSSPCVVSSPDAQNITSSSVLSSNQAINVDTSDNEQPLERLCERAPQHFVPKEQITLVHQRMGSLLKNESPTFLKTDSLGFNVSNSKKFSGNVSDMCITDLPHKDAQASDEVASTVVNHSASDQTHLDTKDSEMTVVSEDACGFEPSVPTTKHLCEEKEPISAQISEQMQHDDVFEMQTQMLTCQNPLESAMSFETQPDTKESDEKLSEEPQNNTSTSALNTSQEEKPEDFVFQKPLPFSSPTRPAPPIRRQLSKRKSEIFGAFVPTTIVEGKEENEDDDSSDDDDDFYSVGGSTGRRSDPCTPTSPKARRLDNYDPYRIFEVNHTPCLILTVRVLRGRNITMGFQDYYDTPDPYINLVMKTSPEGRKSTTVKENNPNPVWDESFTFFINFTQANVLEISLMESNSLWFDQIVGKVFYDIVNIFEMDKPQTETFVFNSVSQVDIEFKLEFDRNPTLRYSLCLSEQEKTFMEKRKEKTLLGMKKLLGEEEGPMSINEVPTIAVIGSGGGFRAMTGYSGVFKALRESGVLDCTTYACGLSGSSWLLSTLYSHPKWPNLDMKDFLDEMKNNIDKRLIRFFNATTMYNYAKYMVQKRREGQPVSFTDIFGRMVGETLLNGRMDARLTDQREKIKDGDIPMPLYTCVHVKKDVPARSFQEWVEFSPYEIGLPKYGTFMDTELFGSKFFMGKLVKKFNEQPLHFLQGIWGSAFCILFKRLLEDNRRIDPVEMVRQEMGKQLEEEGQESSSDCSDDDELDDSSSSTDSSMDSDTGSVRNAGSIDREGDVASGINNRNEEQSDSVLKSNVSQKVAMFEGIKDDTENVSERRNSVDREIERINTDAEMNDSLTLNLQSDGDIGDDNSAYEGEEGGYEDEDDTEEEAPFVTPRGIMKPRGSIELKRARQNQQSLKDSASPDNDIGQDQVDSAPQKSVTSQIKDSGLDQSQDLKKSVNWGACPTRNKNNDGTDGPDAQKRRQAYLKANSSMRKSRSGSKSYWKNFMKGVFESNSWELLSTRRGRAAVIHNFMRGLSLQQTYPLSPFTPIDERVKEGDEFDGIFEMHPTSVKHIYMVDAGLTFNSPYPLVLRPQRGVDIILSFDFSARPSDDHQPFKELLLAEKWAKLNRLPFPPIDASVFEREGMKELYIFRHPTDPHCPIVLHFVLINKRFKYYKKPGVPRETKEEFDFAEFDVFDDPNAPYSTFNFTYTHESFERLSQLMEFNTLLHIDEIKEVIKDVIKMKREGPPRVPIQSKDIKLLRMKSVQEMRKLRKFITRIESRSSLYSANSPSTPSHTFYSTPNGEVSTNPFFSGFRREVSLDSSSDSSGFHTARDRLSESLSRSSRGKKHLKPSDIFVESDKLNWYENAKRDGKPSFSQNSSSMESVFGTPPNTNLFQNMNQNHQLVQNVHMKSLDVCDGEMKDVNETQCEDSEGERRKLSSESGEFDVSDYNAGTEQLSDDSSTQPVTDIMSISHASEHKKSPSPKVFIPDYQQIWADKANNLGKNTSGINSSGVRTDSSGIVADSVGSIYPGTGSPGSKTPATGSFSLASSGVSSGSSSSSVQVAQRSRPKKESPPNPFFAKAFFMRSPHNSSSSNSSSNSSLSSGDTGSGKRMRALKGTSYRLSPQTPSTQSSPDSAGVSGPVRRLTSKSQNLSPLITSESKTSTQVQPTPSPDEFYLAPEAFKADGTPVFDSEEAKMYYEAAKGRRKVFRRQSTISSLNSISLDEAVPVESDKSDENNSDEDTGHSTPCKKKVYSDDHFRSFFFSCQENMDQDKDVRDSDEGRSAKAGMEVEPSARTRTGEYGVDFDVRDLSLFSGLVNSDAAQEGEKKSESS